MAEDLDPRLTDAELAAALVRHAGDLALSIRAGGLTAHTKTNVADVVTSADLAAEAYVLAQLRRCRPHDSILGEEGAAFTGSSGRIWVIDPVDGTYNFFSGSSYWCSALALVEQPVQKHDGGTLTDVPVLLGAVYQPQEGKLWLGGLLAPATLNGVPITVAPNVEIGSLGAATYIHPGWLAEPSAAEPWMRAACLPATLRMLGSGSCDLGRVAQGELGVWFQHSAPAWDWLPGKGIVRAAGGSTGVVHVNGLNWFVAGPARAVAAVEDALHAGTLHDA